MGKRSIVLENVIRREQSMLISCNNKEQEILMNKRCFIYILIDGLPPMRKEIIILEISATSSDE